jgi:hypothetical protein
VSDPRRRALVPERLLLPPPPRDPDLRGWWEEATFEERRRLARASQRSSEGLSPREAACVRELAAARVVTWWRPQVAALVFGWLMLMTLWGFGRSTYPEHEATWLAAGLLAGGAVWLAAGRAAWRRVGRARRVADGGA